MKKQCNNCSKTFNITDQDQEFYRRITVPEPTLCPDCRQQRRLAWRNEDSLYNRTCDLCHKAIISIYQADSSYKVYCHDCWWSEQWSPHEFARDIDWNKPFFEQWQALQLQVPKIALYAANNEQSEYVNMTGYSKNCYLVFAGDYDEDCLYGSQVIKSVSCVETLNCIESEDCYEVVDVEKCYRVWFSQNCKNCADSLFLFDCRGCTDCLFSTNLRNKQYTIFNKQYSPEEYASKKQQILADMNNGKLPELLQQFRDLCVKAIHRPLELANSEGASGDYIFNSHNARQCYDVTNIDNCAYVYTGFNVKDIMDVCHTTDIELGYECTSLGYTSYDCLFSICAWSSRSCRYSLQVKDCHDLFGCIGLTKASYCILNKQYTPEEYNVTVEKLIKHMCSTGEWGEFFPMALSPFAYKETVANQWYPQPDTIKTDITGKAFRVIKQEQDWYQRMGLPLPTVSPEERRKQRFQLRNPRQLWQRQCMCTQPDHEHKSRCGNEFETSYSPDRKELVYCEACYSKEIN